MYPFQHRSSFDAGPLPSASHQHHSTKTELCSFFYRTGSCVYGDRCKFQHQHEPVLLNQAGCPIRPTEPPCTHYLKRGWCAFGPTCKFDHPEPATATVQYSSTLRSFVPVVQGLPMPAAYHQAVARSSLPQQAPAALAAPRGSACYSPVQLQLQLQQLPGSQLLYTGGPPLVQYSSAHHGPITVSVAAPALNVSHLAPQHLTTSHYLLPSSAPMQQHLPELLLSGSGGAALALQHAPLSGPRSAG